MLWQPKIFSDFFLKLLEIPSDVIACVLSDLDRRNHAIWILIPNNVLTLDSGQALSSMRTYVRIELFQSTTWHGIAQSSSGTKLHWRSDDDGKNIIISPHKYVQSVSYGVPEGLRANSFPKSWGVARGSPPGKGSLNSTGHLLIPPGEKKRLHWRLHVDATNV